MPEFKIAVHVSADVADQLARHLEEASELADAEISKPRELPHDPLRRQRLGADPVVEIAISLLTGVAASAAYDLIKAVVQRFSSSQKAKVLPPEADEGK